MFDHRAGVFPVVKAKAPKHGLSPAAKIIRINYDKSKRQEQSRLT